ncbi:MAG: hypothetical protein K2H63_00285 [Paramuribaculum sp.]|nr:hypothetical protein [Paramuribaculum sp.]
MERKITITPEEKRYLAELFKVTEVSVWEAVTFRKHNELHRKIRKAAIERGNPQMVLAPEFDTIYLTNRPDADELMTRYMVQTFANGASLEGNLTDGIVTVRDKRGNVVCVNENPRISELKAIQEMAMSL